MRKNKLAIIGGSGLYDIEGLENPTAEKLCFYFWHRLEETLPNLYQIEIKETEKTGAILKK